MWNEKYPDDVKMTMPGIEGFQEEKSLNPGEKITVEPAKGKNVILR
ncbi:MAG: hypothetical protein KAS23_10010 [Anaerohalosphaera sp.]|nr:hypothetical protein [Anaerohalosphaera sp.]